MKRALLLLPCLLVLTACPLDEDKDKRISELENKILLLQNRPVVQRYQIVMPPQYSGMNLYLLDTQEGKIWQKTTYTDMEGDPSVWMEQDIIDSSGKIGTTLRQWLEYNKPKSKQKK